MVGKKIAKKARMKGTVKLLYWGKHSWYIYFTSLFQRKNNETHLISKPTVLWVIYAQLYATSKNWFKLPLDFPPSEKWHEQCITWWILFHFLIFHLKNIIIFDNNILYDYQDQFLGFEDSTPCPVNYRKYAELSSSSQLIHEKLPTCKEKQSSNENFQKSERRSIHLFL